MSILFGKTWKNKNSIVHRSCTIFTVFISTVHDETNERKNPFSSFIVRPRSCLNERVFVRPLWKSVRGSGGRSIFIVELKSLVSIPNARSWSFQLL